MVESYTLTLPKAGMDLIIAGLSELPYKAAKPVLEEAMRQFIAQEAAAGVPQPGDKTEPEPPAAAD
jgi:hypothetical protein